MQQDTMHGSGATYRIAFLYEYRLHVQIHSAFSYTVLHCAHVSNGKRQIGSFLRHKENYFLIKKVTEH